MASSKLFRQVGEFDPDNEKISTYLERVKLFIEANSVDDEKKVAVLLTIVGVKNYSLLEGLLAPTNPREKSYDELTQVLKAHYEPKPVVIAERYHFYRRCQASGESIAAFVAELRKLAINCQFGAFLDEALRDRLVCGLRSEQTQKRLLSEPELSLAKALQIAQAIEAANNRTKEIKLPGAVISTEVSVLGVNKVCYRCGKRHDAKTCRFKEAKCYKCGKIRHLASVCRSKKELRGGSKAVHRQHQSKQEWPRSHWLESEASPPADSGQQDVSLFAIRETTGNPTIQVEVKVNHKPLVMQVDTGAAVSLISEEEMKSKFPGAQLKPSPLLLKTYTGEVMKVLGELIVAVEYKQQGPKHLSLVVVRGKGPCLFGRNWLHHIRLDWKSIASIQSVQDPLGDVNTLLDKYADVFSEELGTIHPSQAKLVVREGVKPKFCRARQVPFALKSVVEDELDRLEKMGVMEKVNFIEWATPVVVVPKKDGRVRLCGDYKVTLNPSLDVDQYPLPRSEDLFATLAGGKHFSVLDLSNAYQQLLLEEASRKFVTINTHRGLYRYTRLPFGIASAPAIFQKTMDTILQGIPGVLCYIDDLLVTGKTLGEHMRNLEMVLQRAKQYGVRIKREKCRFLQPSVEFLGH